MTGDFSTDPKITYALIRLEDALREHSDLHDPDYKDITTHKKEVLARYQPVFSPDRIDTMTKAEFESFLLLRNNHHWNSLHRVRKYMTEDMDLLRHALEILLDEGRPVRDRLNQLRPERTWGEHSMVSHMGTPVITAILQVAHPDKYGVWNNTSDRGMKKVKLWDRRWEKQPAGDSYVEMNEIYLYLADSLKIDLWTLDALWWGLRE